MMKREFNIIIERDADGYFLASVPNLPGCHTHAKYDIQITVVRLLCFTNSLTAKKSRVFTTVLYY
ncbi:MAG: type II toxin-antitoxin system HicB family antitoxin [Nostoc sp.]